MLPVEDTLSEDNISCVCATNDDIGHDGNANVLLDGEGTGIQRPYVTEGIESGRRKNTFKELANGEGNQLNNNTGDEDGGI